MTTFDFEISERQRKDLLAKFPNLGKNSDVGKYSIEVVKMFFLSKDPASSFSACKGGADLEVKQGKKSEQFEVKGTIDPEICFQKLKVSSHGCHDALVNGMTLIRVTNVGQLKMKLHFMKHGVDFLLVAEPRWAVVKVR
jgi:hypothetical protein